MLVLPTAIPSPSINSFTIGPFTIHFYALCILAGMALAIWITQRRYQARGGDPEVTLDVALWAIPAGIIGGRLYHVVTSWTPYFGPNGDPVEALKIWHGGMGIWGGVLLAVVVAVIYLRYRGLAVAPFADAAAPAILVAQAVGRLGNWFNQEVFGGPTTLPWGLEIAPQYLEPFGIPAGTLVHPTFLYEIIWNLAVAGLIIWWDRRHQVAGGQLLALYAAGYCFGRVLLEGVRVDTTDYVGGIRINFWASVITVVVAVACYFWLGRRQYATRVSSTCESAEAPPQERTEAEKKG